MVSIDFDLNSHRVSLKTNAKIRREKGIEGGGGALCLDLIQTFSLFRGKP